MSTTGIIKSADRIVKYKNGRVHLHKGQIISPGRVAEGYMAVKLYKNGIGKMYLVHRLLGMTFPDLVGWTEDAKGKPYDELQINHRDQNKENNCVENLEWCPAKYNANYGDRNERVAKAQSMPVYQYSLNDKLLKKWDSLNDIERQTGYSASNISKVCLGKRTTAYNYKWSYTTAL